MTDDSTIKSCINAARKRGKKVVVDMICVSDLKKRIETVEELGADVIAVHTGVDQQRAGRTPLDDLREMRKYAKRAEQLNVFKETILKAGHIFTAGAGRSGVAVRAFTNRLMQLGFSVSMVGEISSPHSRKGDLLIIGSGSGETESLIALAQKAKKSGVKIALVTMAPKSTLGQLADVLLVLPGMSPKQKKQQSDIRSIQPMGSSFEQLQFLTYDGIILELMSVMDESSQTMFLRHADFE